MDCELLKAVAETPNKRVKVPQNDVLKERDIDEENRDRQIQTQKRARYFLLSRHSTAPALPALKNVTV